MKKDNLISQIQAACQKKSSDLIIKNINIVDVFSQDTFTSDVAIKNGFIVGFGEYNFSENLIDGTDKFICPGLIDAHAHIESSLVTPLEYTKAALLHGITSIICDPHEISNVLGSKGINLMLDLSKNLPLDFYFMLPSCVPSTSFENSGAILKAKDLSPLYKKDRVLGLAEVMDSPAVLNADSDMIDKLLEARNKGLIIDGHCAGLTIDSLNGYCTAHIRTDHECHSADEMLDRIRRGMYVLIREGTVAKNLEDLVPLASPQNSRRLCFCTDDKHIDDLIKNGSINNSIKTSIKMGLKAETAIQMATLNSAECYNFNNKGAIAPGYAADFIILNDLENFKIESVYKNGQLVVHENKLLIDLKPYKFNKSISNSVHIPYLDEKSIKIDLKNTLNVIEIIPNKLESIHLKIPVSSLDNTNEFESSTDKDLLKIAVIERHNNTNNIGLGVLKGLKIKSGAIATTVAHDSHNVIVTGENDSDMVFAVNELKKIGGGIIVVKNNEVLASIQLEIGGLITSRESNEVLRDLEKLHAAIKIVAPTINFNPFLTLSFLSLPVIPEIKITDKGLFNVKDFKFIPLSE